MTDELSTRREQKRREAVLQALKIRLRLRWYPTWEFEIHAGGPWWFMILLLLGALSISVELTSVVAKIVQWCVAGDWRVLAVAIVAWAAVCAWIGVALVRKLGHMDDDQSGE